MVGGYEKGYGKGFLGVSFFTWVDVCWGNGLWEEVGKMGTSGNRNCHWAPRFHRGCVDYLSRQFVPKLDSPNAESLLATVDTTSLLVELSIRLNTYPSELNHHTMCTLRIRNDAAAQAVSFVYISFCQNIGHCPILLTGFIPIPILRYPVEELPWHSSFAGTPNRLALS